MLINSAFYDDRPNSGSLPNLRLLIVSDVTLRSKLYCYVWYPSFKNAFITRASLFTIHYRRKNPEHIHKFLPSKGFFVEYVMSCQLPNNHSVPSHVSVAVDACTASDVLVPVTVPVKPEHTIDFGVCVAASFGNVDTAVMVQWFELHKILGVKEFNIYNVSMSASMNDVLQYYISTGDLILRHMSPIIPTDDDWTAYMNSLPTLNHCFFTNMYRYEHVVIVDFDEFITPKGERTLNYPELLTNIKKKHSWTCFTFNNELFFYDYPPDKAQPDYLTVLQQRLRNTTSLQNKGSKSISNPQNCMIAGNHQCVKRFPHVKYYTLIKPEIASNHHYRKCNYSPVYKNGKCLFLETSVIDDTMLKYKRKLGQMAKPILEKLGYFNLTS